jgi:putative oxidoreductase
MRKFKTIALWSLTTLLALVFLAAGVSTLVDPAVAGQFTSWGYPDWLAMLVGILEIGGGLILLFPAVAWQGAALLAVVMAGAVFTLVRSGDTAHAIVPALLLGMVVLVGYLRHPRTSLRQRLQAATDWVAEHEIAEQHRWLAGTKH